MGTDAHFLSVLQDYWIDDFDVGAAVDRLNRYPQFIARLSGCDIHVVHVTAEGGRGTPLLLTHGWPGAHYEFFDVIDRLVRPTAYGGRQEDAFDVVVPSLPGFGFSGVPREVMGPRRTADLWHELMVVLGYPTFLVQGGDWGSAVASYLGVRHLGAVRAVHLNMPFLSLQAVRTGSEEERAWRHRVATNRAEFGSYATLQMRRPLSIAWATMDNPLGQAAWIVERFHDWSDRRDRAFEEIFHLDDLLTIIMMYVVEDRFPTSLWFYRGHLEELREDASALYCDAPTGYSAYPNDVLAPPPPLSLIERFYRLEYRSAPRRGGHFPALECPEIFVDDLRDWARAYR